MLMLESGYQIVIKGYKGMKIKKLSTNGFSAIEVVVAVVAVIVVGGLGYYAYSNFSNNTNTVDANTDVKPAETKKDTDGEVTKEEADAIQADAAGSKAIYTSNGQYAARVCLLNSRRNIKILFISKKNWKSNGYVSTRTPMLKITGYGPNYGKSLGYISGGKKWWLGTLQLHHKTMKGGNSDYMSLHYGSTSGPNVAIKSIPNC